MRRPGNFGNTRYWFNPPTGFIDWLFGYKVKPTGRVIEIEDELSANPVFIDRTSVRGKSGEEPSADSWSRRSKVSVPIPKTPVADNYPPPERLDLSPYL